MLNEIIAENKEEAEKKLILMREKINLMQEEVKKLAPKHMKVRLLTPTVRKNSSWYGGSIITSLGSFKNMWITRNEYLEKGDRELFIKTI